MADTDNKTNNLEIRKMLKESILSDELKSKFAAILEDMNEEEKFELIQIIEESNKAKEEHEAARKGKLARINAALEKHLRDVMHEEERNVRTEFENLEKSEDEAEIKELETELNNL